MKYLDILIKGIELGKVNKEWESEIHLNTQSERAETLRLYMMDNSACFTPLLIDKGLLSYDEDLMIYHKKGSSDEEFYNELAEIYSVTSGIITESEMDYYEVCDRVGKLCESYYLKLIEDGNVLKEVVSGKPSKVKNIWYDELKKMLEDKMVLRTYCFREIGFSSDYYMVITKDENRYLVEHKVNNVNTRFMISGLVREVGKLPFLTKLSYDEVIQI